MTLTFHQLRRRLAALPEGFHRQMGLRHVRDALALADRNPERVAEHRAIAERVLAEGEAA